MRGFTHDLLSRYLLGKTSIEDLREFVEDINWDDTQIPEDERAILLGVEGRIAGMDEGFNDESELFGFLNSSIVILDEISPFDQQPTRYRVFVDQSTSDVSLPLPDVTITPTGSAPLLRPLSSGKSLGGVTG